MSKKLYGALENRLEEGKNFNEDGLIHEGDDITMYYYSDCHCYYVTKVIDQKHIFVKEYEVCADHSKEGGMGHQNWLYFKTLKEQHKYLNSIFHENKYDENPVESKPEEWVFRNNSWKEASRFTQEKINAIIKRDGFFRFVLTNKQQEKLSQGKEIIIYTNLAGKVSFGVRNYYYDWSF